MFVKGYGSQTYYLLPLVLCNVIKRIVKIPGGGAQESEGHHQAVSSPATQGNALVLYEMVLRVLGVAAVPESLLKLVMC